MTINPHCMGETEAAAKHCDNIISHLSQAGKLGPQPKNKKQKKNNGAQKRMATIATTLG